MNLPPVARPSVAEELAAEGGEYPPMLRNAEARSFVLCA
jgi:hypothetical protein